MTYFKAQASVRGPALGTGSHHAMRYSLRIPLPLPGSPHSSSSPSPSDKEKAWVCQYLSSQWLGPLDPAAGPSNLNLKFGSSEPRAHLGQQLVCYPWKSCPTGAKHPNQALV
jgi:hypothetical protein